MIGIALGWLSYAGVALIKVAWLVQQDQRC